MTDLSQDGVDVDAVFVLSNGRRIAVQDWYADHETEDREPAYKVYSGMAKMLIPVEEVEEIVTEFGVVDGE